MKHAIPNFILLLFMSSLLASCEKMVIENDDVQEPSSAKQNVVIRVAGMDTEWNETTSRAQTSISEVCTRLQFAVFQGDSRVRYENQNIESSNFGTFALQLETGTYQLLALGHSGATNVTTTNPSKLQFTNPSASNGTGFTDTFYYYGDLVVSSDGTQVNINMKRATSMFRLKTNDVKPSNVKKFQFYYTGGSGALDATTGLGCVNSQQSVFVTLDDVQTGQPLTFEMYTFLHDEEGAVTFTVKAFGATDNILYTKEFKNVSMKRNCITQYSGDFFTNDDVDTPDEPITPQPSEPSSGVVYVDPEWADVFEYTF